MNPFRDYTLATNQHQPLILGRCDHRCGQPH